MATLPILRPNATAFTSTNWSSTSHVNISDGNDSTLSVSNVGTGTFASIKFPITDVPEDFVSMTTISIKVRCRLALGNGDDSYSVRGELVAGGSNVALITAAAQGIPNGAQTLTTYTFTGAIQSSVNDKFNWNGAQVSVVYNRSSVMGADSNGLEVADVWLEGTYAATPSAVTNLNASSTTNNEATLSWTAPASGDSAITRYDSRHRLSAATEPELVIGSAVGGSASAASVGQTFTATHSAVENVKVNQASTTVIPTIFNIRDGVGGTILGTANNHPNAVGDFVAIFDPPVPTTPGNVYFFEAAIVAGGSTNPLISQDNTTGYAGGTAYLGTTAQTFDLVMTVNSGGYNPFTSWVSTGSAATGATVTGLTGNVSYDFQVRAVSAIGNAGASNVASTTISSGPQSATKTPTVVAATVTLPAAIGVAQANATVTPSVTATSAALPASTRVLTSNATVTPAPITAVSSVTAGAGYDTTEIQEVTASVVTLPQATGTANTSATVTPGVIAAVTTMPVSSRAIGTTKTATVFAATTGLPVSSQATGATKTAAVIAAVTTLPASTEITTSSATKTPAVIAATSTLPVSARLVGSTVSPVVTPMIAALPASTRNLTQNALQTPAVITASTTMATPVTSSALFVSPLPISVVAGLPASIEIASVSRTPDVTATFTSLAAVTPALGKFVSPAVVALITSAPVSARALFATQTPAVVAALSAMPSAVGAAMVVRAPDAIAATTALPAASRTAGSVPTPVAIAAAATLPASTRVLSKIQAAPVISVTTAMGLATKVAGASRSPAVITAVVALPVSARALSQTQAASTISALVALPAATRRASISPSPGVVVLRVSFGSSIGGGPEGPPAKGPLTVIILSAVSTTAIIAAISSTVEPQVSDSTVEVAADATTSTII